MRRPLPHLSVLAVVAVVAVGSLAGCGIDEDVVARTAEAADPPTDPPAGSTATTEGRGADEVADSSSPFTVEGLPDGYELRVEGTGEDEPGADDRAVTVLAPDGEPVGPGVVLVEVTTSPDEAGEGFVPEGSDSRWASLTADGVRVWGLDATEDELEAVADASTGPDGPGRAPVVEDPPAGLEVVGSIAVDGVLGLRAGVPTDDAGPASTVPGPASAHTTVWADEASSLVVMTLPGDALDPAAVVTEVRPPRRAVDEARDAVAEDVTVGEATGVVTTTARAATGAVVRRELAVETAWGDVLLVVSRGADILDADALVAVAGSVSQA